MLRRIKYRLLRWLLDDICEKSTCVSCCCFETDIFTQARKVWGLMSKDESLKSCSEQSGE